MATWRFLWALFQTNLKATFALRGAFWIQVFFMVANNLIFWTIWFFFFRKFKELNGWRLPEVTILYGMVAAAFGLVMVTAGGLRNLARVIAEGDLDIYLTHPKSVIAHVAGSQSLASGWGDLIAGAVLLVVSGLMTPTRWLIAVTVIVAAAFVYGAATIVLHSIAFWASSGQRLARDCTEYLLMFSVYPQSIYTGWLRIMIFTLLPAGFIGYLPVEAVRDASFSYAGMVLAAAIGYSLLALFVFSRGLRRYASGSRLQIRA